VVSDLDIVDPEYGLCCFQWETSKGDKNTTRFYKTRLSR